MAVLLNFFEIEYNLCNVLMIQVDERNYDAELKRVESDLERYSLNRIIWVVFLLQPTNFKW